MMTVRALSSFLDPTSKIPEVTQRMWEYACSDLEEAEIRLKIAYDLNASGNTIKSRLHDVRIRNGICNGINFLITNRADINAVIAKKRQN